MDGEHDAQDYLEQDDDSLLASQSNGSENSSSLFPNLSSHLSDFEGTKIANNQLIEQEQQNNQPLVQGGSCPPSPKQTLPKQVPPASVHRGLSKPRSVLESKPNKKDDWLWILFTIGIAVVLAIIAIYLGKITFWSFVTSEQNGHRTARNKPVICAEFTALNTEFPQQSDSFWAFLKSGVERVNNKAPTKPSIFMLLHESDVDIKLILNKIVEATQTCLGTLNRTPIHLTAAKLKAPEYLNDYGRVISDYKSALSDSGIMIVENFSNVPPYVAQAFHTICDGETPYVPRSVIYLTMPVKRISTNDNPFKIAEKQLTELWGSSLKGNVLGPLLYRVTDVTLHVNRGI
jgi:hypothetical protein